MSTGDKVWIIEDGVVGEVIRYGAVMSLVRWTSNGIEYTEHLENYEFLDYEEIEVDNEEI